MHNSTVSLLAGIREVCDRAQPPQGESAAFQLDYLAHTVGYWCEGSTEQKKKARELLQKLTGRGRCILNAADLAAKQNGELKL